jgi:hypothetical protein
MERLVTGRYRERASLIWCALRLVADAGIWATASSTNKPSGNREHHEEVERPREYTEAMV